MGGVYTIYAYFNSEQIQAILNSVVMLVGSSGVNGDYLSIIRVAAMMGLLMAAREKKGEVATSHMDGHVVGGGFGRKKKSDTEGNVGSGKSVFQAMRDWFVKTF